jgi:hypothetical protein
MFNNPESRGSSHVSSAFKKTYVSGFGRPKASYDLPKGGFDPESPIGGSPRSLALQKGMY